MRLDLCCGCCLSNEDVDLSVVAYFSVYGDGCLLYGDQGLSDLYQCSCVSAVIVIMIVKSIIAVCVNVIICRCQW